MKNLILIISGLFILAVACQQEDQLIEKTPAIDTQQVLKNCQQGLLNYDATEFPKQAQLKSHGNAVTRHLVFKETTGTIYVVTNMGDCSDFYPPLQMVVEGEGTANHIGKYQVLNLTCVDPDGNFLTPVFGYITAANGDEIHTQMGIPYPDPDDPDYMYFPYTIIGGTGRFAEATGEALMEGTADFVNGIWTLSGEGNITY